MSASYGSYSSALQATTMHSKEKTYVRYGWKHGPKKATEGWKDGRTERPDKLQGIYPLCKMKLERLF